MKNADYIFILVEPTLLVFSQQQQKIPTKS